METKKKNVMRAYLRWPFLLGILLILMTAAGFVLDRKLGLWMACFTAAYYLVSVIIYAIYRKSLLKKLVDFGSAYAQVQNQMLRQIHIPFAMCNKEGDIFWSNGAFMECFAMKQRQGHLVTIFPEMEHMDLKAEKEYHVVFGDRKYLLSVSKLAGEAAKEIGNMVSASHQEFFNIYLIDETDLVYYRTTLDEERSVMMLIFLDNYDEVMGDVEYVRRSLLSALVERKLNKYVSSVHGVISKLEKDRYLVVMKQKALWKMEEDRFSLLEDIKTVNIGNEKAITLSIGIGVNGESAAQDFDFARASIDMALGRGGDQAVVKDNGDIKYYGGSSQGTERNNRVKARMKAHALKELIEASEYVLIMGHPMADLDCLGAAMGIYRAARFSDKRANIVIGGISSSAEAMINMLRQSGDYDEDLFISGEEAVNAANKDTLLVIVDTNRASYTECPQLLDIISDVVVLDHHRQAKDHINNAVLSYIEPYASSAAELAAEVIQYYDDTLRLRPKEADAMFAGIVMDTNNFEDKCGVRTFEAAAYLRRSGADATRVRKLFRDSMEDYKLRAETISHAELFEKDYIISICPSAENGKNQTVVAAQAANELLEIRGIKASFVLTDVEGKIYLSARSIDEVNVQIMMEKLGGGGHLSVAGAQFENQSMEEVVGKLKDVILEEIASSRDIGENR